MRNRLSDMFGPTADCPSDEDLLNGLHAPPDAAAKESWHRHVAACPHCIARLELFRGFESGKPSEVEQPAVDAIVLSLRRNSPARPQPWWRRKWNAWVLAPAALAVAAVLVLTIVNVNPRSRNLETPTDTVTRSAEVIVTAPLGDVSNAPDQLRWRPFAGASRYEVRLVEVDRTELWRSETQSTSLELPLPVRAKIVPLKKLFWEVTAFDAAGNSLASSGLRSFTLRN